MQTSRPAKRDLQQAIQQALQTVSQNRQTFATAYPDDTTANNVYQLRKARPGFAEGANYGWTTSFWPGMLWLAYELSGDASYRATAEVHLQSFIERIEGDIDMDTHDIGFLYTLSCVAPWRLTGNASAKRAALLAADRLMQRYLAPAGIFQAWGDLANPEQRGRAIVDSLMNMPLLYWASEMTGDQLYAEAAHRHAIQLRDHIIRPDNTTFHTFYWDAETGQPIRGRTEQGHADHSCWARGQAWAIYGFSLNYRATKDRSLLDAAQRCADYFLEHLPSDSVAYWDLALTDGSGEERDSSAAAIAVCGLYELARWLPDGPEKQRYQAAAGQILESLVANYTPEAGQSNALLLHGVYDKPKWVGVDEGNLWGDYFYLEALMRTTRPDWPLYW